MVGECTSSRPRAAVETPLHWAVREGLADFIEAAEAKGGLPAYILKEFTTSVSCGDWEGRLSRIHLSLQGPIGTLQLFTDSDLGVHLVPIQVFTLERCGHMMSEKLRRKSEVAECLCGGD